MLHQEKPLRKMVVMRAISDVPQEIIRTALLEKYLVILIVIYEMKITT